MSANFKRLKEKGLIRGFTQIPGRNITQNGQTNIPSKKSKALRWLDLNIQYWCNERALMLEKEFKFCPERGWRFDYAITALKIAIEFEGGIFLSKSGHNTAKHYTKDTDKYNSATTLGWRLIRVTAMNYLKTLSYLNELMK